MIRHWIKRKKHSVMARIVDVLDFADNIRAEIKVTVQII